MNSSHVLTVACLLVAALPLTPRAQEPRLSNAQLHPRAVEGGLQKTARALITSQNGAAWLGYAVPLVEGNWHIGSSSADDAQISVSLRHYRSKLEDRGEGMNFQDNDKSDGAERSGFLLVLFRLADHNISRIRLFTDDCELDGGGMNVFRLTNVQPRESIEFLASFVGAAGDGGKLGRRNSETAIAAIALHANPSADRALERFVEPGRPETIREDTAFWLGNVRGQPGYEVLNRLVREDPSERVREQCIFTLHLSKVPAALDTIIDLARNDHSAHLRSQALFWLSQKAGEKAAKALSDAIENDPEAEVKKKAVFALSQLPKDQGIPRLIQVARANRNREVRKDAMFWLGQSNGPRAVDFFGEVLTH
jgi:hypothetical protein